jgi:hypothetical protein
MKTPLTQFAQASEEPAAELFFDESLSRIPSVDLKEIQRLSRFLPVIVLIPRSTAKNQVALRKITLVKSSKGALELAKIQFARDQELVGTRAIFKHRITQTAVRKIDS